VASAGRKARGSCLGKGKEAGARTTGKRESWRALPLERQCPKPFIPKEFLKVLVETLTPIPLRRSGLSFLITLETNNIILPVGGFGLIDILYGLMFLGEWLGKMACKMRLKGR
jgi:hypothetical protein